MYGVRVDNPLIRKFLTRDDEGEYFTDMRMRIMTIGKRIAEDAWKCKSTSIPETLKRRLRDEECFWPLVAAIRGYDKRSGFVTR